MSREEEALARYQEELLEILGASRSPDEALARLSAEPALAPYADYIAGLELRGLEVGIELVQRWGERRREAAPGKMLAPTLPAIDAPFEFREVPIPEPGPQQVRLRMEASGICGTDLKIWRGSYAVPMPIVLGHEPVGIVEALGEGVTELQVGQRVGVPWMQRGCGACERCARGQAKYCARMITWLQNGGGHAQRMKVEAAGCVPIPAGLEPSDVAPLFCAGFTAISGYLNAKPRPGDRVAVMGLGGLGHLAVQIAKAHGHEVWVVTTDATKAREARELGADEVILDQGEVGRALGRAGGVDILLATSSSMEQSGEAMRGLRPEGRFVSIGIGAPITFDPLLLAGKQATIVGSMQSERADLELLLGLAARGAVKARVEVYPLGQLTRAMMRLAERRVRYRAVLMHAA